MFALSGRAKAAITEKGKDAVINATVGALLDDNGDLVVMTSVTEAIRSLTPADYAEYAPITGTPAFKDAVVKALFGSYGPSGHVRLCVTPGGTGSITSVIQNYSSYGDSVLTHDWCWANYKTIAVSQGRQLKTFRFFNEEGRFDAEDLVKQLGELAAVLLGEEPSESIIFLIFLQHPGFYPVDQVILEVTRAGLLQLLIEHLVPSFERIEESRMELGRQSVCGSVMAACKSLLNNILAGKTIVHPCSIKIRKPFLHEQIYHPADLFNVYIGCVGRIILRQSHKAEA